MRDPFCRVVVHVATLLTRPNVLGFRDEALRNWMLPGGIEAVQANMFAKLRAALDYSRSQADGSVPTSTHENGSA